MRTEEDFLLCPISGQTMTDPVVDHEGNSYDRAFILEWLTRSETSPITRNPLRLDQLSPNRVLRDLLRSKGIAEVGATATATDTDDTNNNNDSEQEMLVMLDEVDLTDEEYERVRELDQRQAEAREREQRQAEAREREAVTADLLCFLLEQNNMLEMLDEVDLTDEELLCFLLEQKNSNDSEQDEVDLTDEEYERVREREAVAAELINLLIVNLTGG